MTAQAEYPSSILSNYGYQLLHCFYLWSGLFLFWRRYRHLLLRRYYVEPDRHLCTRTDPSSA